MSDQPASLSPDRAREILAAYARRQFGLSATIGGVSYREDFQVWEAWITGVSEQVKAYIVRLAPSNGEWVCRHISLMDRAPGNLPPSP